jgi:hypothetical protein
MAQLLPGMNPPAGSVTNVDASMDFDTEVDWYNRVESAEDIEVSYGWWYELWDYSLLNQAMYDLIDMGCSTRTVVEDPAIFQDPVMCRD